MGIENQEAFDRMMNEDRIRLRREIAARVLPELLRREYETPGDDSRAIEKAIEKALVLADKLIEQARVQR